MTFLMTYAFLRTLTRGNHCACLVEAVGIEPASDHRASPDLVAIAGNVADGETPLDPSESELADQLGTRVQNLATDARAEWVRRVWEALRVV
jgi:hypothetical protein